MCALMLIGLAPGCAVDPGLRCGAGTTLDAGRCVAPPRLGPSGVAADACGDGTREVAGFCVPDVADVASVEGCQAGPRVMHFDGNDYIYNGVLTVTEADWQDYSSSKRIWQMLQIGAFPGQHWGLLFDSLQLEIELIPGMYERAERAPFASPGHPGIDIGGDGRGCETSGRFQIHEIGWGSDGKLANLLLSFEQHCSNTLSSALAGCLRYQP